MELLLNLAWTIVASILCAGCVLAQRRGRVRLPLWQALGCCCMIAALLFPAISMTDDLQRASNVLEIRLLAATALDAGQVSIGSAALPLLLLSALFAGALLLRLLWLERGSELRDSMESLVGPSHRVRPPTGAAARA